MALFALFFLTFPIIAWPFFTTLFTIASSSSSSELPLYAPNSYFNQSLLLNATVLRNHNALTHFVKVGVGSKTIPLMLTLDTGTDVTWVASDTLCTTQDCTGYRKKSSTTAYPVSCISNACRLLQNGRKKYSGCRDGGCDVMIDYADGFTVIVELIRDKLTFDQVSSSVVFGFGIGHMGRDSDGTHGSDGVLGMGRGKLSIPEQVYFSGVVAYCLVPYKSTSNSTLMFDDPSFPNDYITMPYSINTYRPHLYYLPIIGISIDGDLLRIPQKDFETGRGGFILDTGTSVTQLLPPIYKDFITMFEEQMDPSVPRRNRPLGNGMNLRCYNFLSSYEEYFPEVAIHFLNGFELTLQLDQVVINILGYGTCLAFLEAQTVYNTFGNYQQQTYKFALDVHKHTFGVKPTPHCNF